MHNDTGSSDQNEGLPQTPSAASSHHPDSIKLTLENAALWEAFNSIGTEMTISKWGRRMFPNFKITLTGLQPLTKYIIMADIVPADGFRYSWAKGHWEKVGKAAPQPSHRMYMHPDSPARGRDWMSEPLSFLKMKLTNNKRDNHDYIMLNSMHRYIPRFHVIPTPSRHTICWGSSRTFTFPETAFIAVTTYQDPKITKLKIDNNPFATSFREGGTHAESRRSGKTKRSRTGKAVKQESDSGSVSPVNASPPPGLQMMPSPSQLVQAENQVSVQESLKGHPPGLVVEGHSPEHIHTGTRAELQGHSGHEQMKPLSPTPQCLRPAEFAGFPPGFSYAAGAHTFSHYPLSSVENVWPQHWYQNNNNHLADWGQSPLFFDPYWSTPTF